MKTITIQLETLICPSCTQKIESSVKKVAGVQSVSVLFNSSRAKVTVDEATYNEGAVEMAIKRVGFKVLGVK